jgi:TolB protein
MKRFIFVLILAVAFLGECYAVDLELTQGLKKALPISIVPFKNLSQKRAAIISKIIKKDLLTTGLFRMVPFELEGKAPSNALQVDFSYWKSVGTNNLIVGEIAPLDDGRFSVSFQLLDPISKAHILLSKEYKVDSKDFRSLAHHISDLVYQQLTGEKGVFSTRIAYVLVARTPDKPVRYSLEIADYDGHAAVSLLVSSEPLMSPSWSPDSKKIAYVSFENKRAEIYVINIITGDRTRISSYPGINGAPKWSPDGRQLAIVLSKSGEPKIYLYQFDSKKLVQLTFGLSIDTEPYFSPDGKSLLFTSSRGGSPQIYEIALGSHHIKRVTFDGNYNTSASYLPSNDGILMLHKSEKHYNIAIQNLDSGELFPLTFSDFDESPSLSPNGQLILYATQLNGKGILRIVSTDGKIRLQLPHKKGDIQNPAWSPYLLLG